MSRTYTAEGVVLKRLNYAEADRIVTIYTHEYGKVVCIAKGVRRPQSKKKSSLEPATQARFFFARGRGWDILTQTQLINSFASARQSLTRLTQIYQILEIIDNLTVEAQNNPEVYRLLVDYLTALEKNGSQKNILLENINQIIKALGFTHDKKFSESGLKRYIEELSDRQLKSKAFLTPKGSKL